MVNIKTVPIAKAAALLFVLLGLIASLCGLVAPGSASAQNCLSHIVIYSQTGVFKPVSTAPSGYTVRLDPNNVYCYTVSFHAPYDLRVITPGATMVMVRYFGYQPPPLTLSGLINRSRIPMTKISPPPSSALNSQIYDSPWMALDPTLRGKISARLGTLDSNVYHTVD